MKTNIFLIGLIALMTLLVSCDKDNELKSEINDLATENGITPPANVEITSTKQIELITETTAFSSKSNAIPQRIFEETYTNVTGVTQLWIEKSQMQKDHIFICRVIPTEGNPNLWIFSKNGQGKLRLITYSYNPGLMMDSAEAGYKDLKDNEYQLFYNIYNGRNSSYRIEIDRIYADAGSSDNCVLKSEDFENYQTGRYIGPQSRDWSVLLAKEGGPFDALVYKSGNNKMLLLNEVRQAPMWNMGVLKDDEFELSMKVRHLKKSKPLFLYLHADVNRTKIDPPLATIKFQNGVMRMSLEGSHIVFNKPYDDKKGVTFHFNMKKMRISMADTGEDIKTDIPITASRIESIVFAPGAGQNPNPNAFFAVIDDIVLKRACN